MGETLNFNVNHKVRVKLTAEGKRLWENREQAYADTLGISKLPLPTEDAEGWSEWQLWYLMSTFGPHLHNGCEVPFETTIQIELPAAQKDQPL